MKNDNFEKKIELDNLNKLKIYIEENFEETLVKTY
jgi:hypothetical protein